MKRIFSWSTARGILLGFALVILLGSLLLSLPFASADGKGVSYPDALFTAASATCVTGLVTVTTATAWSWFGQAVILLLIQIGGLGVVTVTTGMMLLFHRRLGLTDRLFIQDSFNLDTLSGLVRFVKKVLLGTGIVEGIGALCYLPAFLPRFGARGIWVAVFQSVSAFCNAGMDLIGENSLVGFAADPWVCGVTCALILLGGIGFLVWWDVLRVLGARRTGNRRRLWGALSLHSRIALSATAFLLLAGTALFLLFESHNPLTLQGRPFGEQLLAAFFQSVTTRTAGFATILQENLSPASVVVSLVLMFIGGSPVSTAGGIKTVTAAILCAAALSVVRSREQVVLFGRAVEPKTVLRALAVCLCSFCTALVSTLLLAQFVQAPLADLLYETISATATVGLSRALTPALPVAGKLIVSATMLFGRVGPISLATALGGKGSQDHCVKAPVESVRVG